MLQRIARLAIAAPRRIIGFAVFVFIAAAVFGVPVADSLSPGGFQDPRSESARAIEVLTDKFGQSGENADRGYGSRGRRQPTCPRGRD
ncbi:transmembrane transport protein mmpL13a [Mycobacterium tuberculosis]|nr:transmembrane transport protein mmpL13a [Mycobacterium tuberculosis]